MNYCCKELHILIENEESPFEYDPKIREHCVVEKPKAFRKKNEATLGYQIRYCPHCGTKFPNDLRDEWFEIVKKKFGIKNILDERIKQLPEEYTTEEWWRKREL